MNKRMKLWEPGINFCADGRLRADFVRLLRAAPLLFQSWSRPLTNSTTKGEIDLFFNESEIIVNIPYYYFFLLLQTHYSNKSAITQINPTS